MTRSRNLCIIYRSRSRPAVTHGFRPPVHVMSGQTPIILWVASAMANPAHKWLRCTSISTQIKTCMPGVSQVRCMCIARTYLSTTALLLSRAQLPLAVVCSRVFARSSWAHACSASWHVDLSQPAHSSSECLDAWLDWNFLNFSEFQQS